VRIYSGSSAARLIVVVSILALSAGFAPAAETAVAFPHHYRLRGPDLGIRANSCPVVGDWDGDGDPDLAVIGSPFEFVIGYNVLPGAPAGSRRTISLPFLKGLTREGLALWPGDSFDFDADGDVDLVLGGPAGRVVLYENTQITSVPILFVKRGRLLLDTGEKNGVIPDVVDWNGDGRADLVVGFEEGTISLFLRSGDERPAGFARGRALVSVYGEPLSVRARAAPEAVDWDGDGDFDLFVGTGAGAVLLFINEGDNAAPRYRKGRALSAGGRPVNRGGLATPRVLDWDQDGDLDLLVGGPDGDVDVYLNPGGGVGPTYEPGGRVPGLGFANGLAVPQTPSLGDWDGDGDLDLALSGFRLYRNTGTDRRREFRAPAVHLGPGPRPGSCVVDWNNDGDLDILYLDEASGLAVTLLENAGSRARPAFPPKGRPILVGGKPLKTARLRGVYVGPWGNAARLWAGDWDGDGKKDILLGGEGIDVCRNTGTDATPVLALPTPIVDVTGGRLRDRRRIVVGLSLGDVDSDGRKDLVVTRYASAVWFRNVAESGKPRYEPGRRIRELSDFRNCVAQVVDWNGDAHSDLLVYGRTRGRVGLHVFSRVEIPDLAPAAVSANAGGVNILSGPYLQNVGREEITVCWKTDVPATTRVTYGETDALSRSAGSHRKRTHHEITLRGLNPGRTYRYRVGSGTTMSRMSAFTTAPPDGSPFRFVVYSDCQRANYDHVRTIRRVAELRPDVVLYAGDQCGFFEFTYLASEVFRRTPFFPALGNTDLSTSRQDRFLAFKENYALPHNERYYSFDYGAAHFVALNSFEEFEKGSPQYAWLEKDLEDASRRKGLLFVYFHVPPYSSGAHGKQSFTLRHRVLCPLFEKYGVDVVFNGHDHAYEHLLVNGVHYVVTGGGSQTRGVGRLKWTVHSEKTLECVLAEVDGDSVTITGVRPDGSEFDKFTCHK